MGEGEPGRGKGLPLAQSETPSDASGRLRKRLREGGSVNYTTLYAYEWSVEAQSAHLILRTKKKRVKNLVFSWELRCIQCIFNSILSVTDTNE